MFTPREIRDTEFDKVSRGYNVDDVDAFLQQLASQVEQLTAERDDALNKLQPLYNQLAQYQEEENAIRSALVSAEKMRETILNEANQQHDILLKDAEQKAARIIDSARTSVVEESKLLEKIKAEVTAFKSQILGMYESHLRLIGSLPDYSIPTDEDFSDEVASDKVEQVSEEPEVKENEIITEEPSVPEIQVENTAVQQDYTQDTIEVKDVETSNDPEQEQVDISEIPPLTFAPVFEEPEDNPFEEEFSVDKIIEKSTDSTIDFSSNPLPDFVIENFSLNDEPDDKPYEGFAPRRKPEESKFSKLDFGEGFSFKQ